jgi:hypothetical protein
MRRDKPDTEAQDRELVRAYLADELAPEVRRAVEERLAADEAFFDLYWMTIAAERLARSRARPAPRARARWRRVAFVAGMILVPLAGLAVGVKYRQRLASTNADLAAGRAVTTDIWFPVRYATGANPGYLNFGKSAVRLAPDSRLTHGLAFALLKGHGYAAIDGHARIETQSATVVVMTSTAEFLLRAHGRYIIDAPIGGAETTVEVRSGSAGVEPADVLKVDGWRRVIVLPGAKGRVTRDGRSEVVAAAEGAKDDE